MDMNLVITLLTIAIVLLSLVIVALLVAVILVIIKVNHIAKSIDAVTSNLANATNWVNPVKIFTEVFAAFRKNK